MAAVVSDLHQYRRRELVDDALTASRELREEVECTERALRAGHPRPLGVSAAVGRWYLALGRLEGHDLAMRDVEENDD